MAVLPRVARRFVAAALIVAVPTVVAAQNGVTFTYRVQSTAAQRANVPSANMLATVRIAGPNARIDFREGGSPLTQNGGYMVVRGAEQSMMLVNAKEKQVMTLDAGGLGQMMGALTNNGLIKMSMKDARFAYEDLGAGERILGYPTRRLRITQGATTEMRVMMKKSSQTDTTTMESWVAPSIPGVDPAALRGWGRAFGSGVRQYNAELAAQMADFDQRYGGGLALRSVAVTSSHDDKGRATVDTMRMEVPELTKGRVDPSIFDVPAGYQTVDMRQMGQAVGAAMDSARRAGGNDGGAGTSLAGEAKAGANEGAREAVRDGARNAAKNAVGGIFGRRRP